jgi:hypothetical protein
MDANRTDPYEERFLSGVKTAAFVIILGAVALMADHAFFIAPQKAPATLAPAATVAPVIAGEGFALTDALRPTEADREPPPPSF